MPPTPVSHSLFLSVVCIYPVFLSLDCFNCLTVPRLAITRLVEKVPNTKTGFSSGRNLQLYMASFFGVMIWILNALVYFVWLNLLPAEESVQLCISSSMHILILPLNIRTISPEGLLTRQTETALVSTSFSNLDCYHILSFQTNCFRFARVNIVTGSCAVSHQSWVVRCSPHSLDFSWSNQANCQKSCAMKGIEFC